MLPTPQTQIYRQLPGIFLSMANSILCVGFIISFLLRKQPEFLGGTSLLPTYTTNSWIKCIW